MLKHINNLGISSKSQENADGEAQKLNKMLLGIRKKNHQQKRMAMTNVPEMLLK